MLKHLAQKALRPLRRLAARFVAPEIYSFTGRHGCVRAASSFVSWNQIPGDYLEFGVYKGESLAAAYHSMLAERRAVDTRVSDDADYRAWKSNPPRFFAFDSFQGMPEGQVERQADFFVGALTGTEAEVRRTLARERVDLTRVVTVPGFYDQSLTEQTKRRLGLTRAALVMIDCDLYESTVPVLAFITDLISQGSVLIFHDWFRFKGSPDRGEQRACREWLARNPHIELIEFWREGPQAVAFLVNYRTPPARP